ncbi:uncharacterized protein ACA1_092700 [Acanthamoeba castellanii str. Neff]|uniref:Uncharacterized protein n=1 Tax=Acanthamoeba castellanii (strain ATCC 30010 / Neff) TaxID=1257118 RepID=L8GIC9_ACACF|nr:uncharacterized protein ACA1_092700 [Acanthamoeba castellanii str. Neff]ELR12737.1 hypothetical protein ACA1_092700 [Acanthamoeba castellanii str. Neff]
MNASPALCATVVPLAEKKTQATTQLHKITGCSRPTATAQPVKIGTLAGAVPHDKVSFVDTVTKASIEFPLYAEEELFVCSFKLEPLKLDPDEVPIDDDAPTTHEQFQDGQRRNAKMRQQCLRFLQQVGKTQPEVLSVERRMAFMRDRLADTASSRKEE